LEPLATDLGILGRQGFLPIPSDRRCEISRKNPPHYHKRKALVTIVTSLPGQVAVEENENKRALKYTEEDIKNMKKTASVHYSEEREPPSFFPSSCDRRGGLYPSSLGDPGS
jgi:hypothetical protein